MKANPTTHTLLLFLCVTIFSCCSDDPPNSFCRPGESKCSEDEGVVLTCRIDGSDWESHECAENSACRQGSCQDIGDPPAICEPASLRCRQDLAAVERCDTSGTAWEEVLSCPEKTACLDGLCLEDPCTAGQTECGPTTLYECNDQGQWESRDCPQGQPCILGKCIECLKASHCDDGEDCVEGTCQYVSPEIVTMDLPDGVVQSAYEAIMESSGGKPPLTWTLSQGELPQGLELTGDGIVTGTPTTPGTKKFTVTLRDDAGESFSRDFSIQIFAEGPVRITTKSIKTAKEGIAYSFQLSAAGGTSPYAWQILEGSLPQGLSLGSTGDISGTPVEIGSFPLEIRVVDASSPPTYEAKNFTLDVQVSPLEILGLAQFDLLLFKVVVLAPLIPYLPYSANLEARGGLKPYTWKEQPAPVVLKWLIAEWGMPAGLKMNSSGRISGSVTNTSDAVTIDIPNGPSLSGYFFLGKVTDSQSPSRNAQAIFCIPTIAL